MISIEYWRGYLNALYGVLTQFILVEEVLVFVSATKVENTPTLALTQHCIQLRIITYVYVIHIITSYKYSTACNEC